MTTLSNSHAVFAGAVQRDARRPWHPDRGEQRRQYTSGQPLSGAVQVPDGASSVTLTITNASGAVVRSASPCRPAPACSPSAGTARPTTARPRPAVPTTSTSAQSVSGRNQAATTLLNGTVTSVTLDAAGGGVTLNTPELGPDRAQHRQSDQISTDSTGAHSMSFGIALSGLDAAQSDLNVTANNIANSATTGFKSSRSQFAELFAVSPQGTSSTQIGNGVQLQAGGAAVHAGQHHHDRQQPRPGAQRQRLLRRVAALARCSTRAPARSRPMATATSSMRPARTCRCIAPTPTGGFNTTSLAESADHHR